MMNSKKVSPSRSEHDVFCWRCHKMDTTKKCGKCIRSFHIECLSETDIDQCATSSVWICPVCRSLEQYDKKKDLEILPMIMRRVFEDKTYAPLKSPIKPFGNPKFSQTNGIGNPVDLNVINTNIGEYKSFDEFITDAKWIVHNCTIRHGVNHEKTRLARMFITELDTEIESAKTCSSCYLHAIEYPDTWFQMACDVPHLMVWVKIKGNFWPGKLMSSDGHMVNVRFFGDHTHADISANSCYLYTQTTPKKNRTQSGMFKAALQEANAYINNIQQKFGSFRLATATSAINPSMIDTYILDMIPTYANHHEDEDTSFDDDDDSEDDEMDEYPIDPKLIPESTSQQLMKPQVVISLNRIDDADKQQRKRPPSPLISTESPVKRAKTNQTTPFASDESEFGSYESDQNESLENETNSDPEQMNGSEISCTTQADIADIADIDDNEAADMVTNATEEAGMGITKEQLVIDIVEESESYDNADDVADDVDDINTDTTTDADADTNANANVDANIEDDKATEVDNTEKDAPIITKTEETEKFIQTETGPTENAVTNDDPVENVDSSEDVIPSMIPSMDKSIENASNNARNEAESEVTTTENAVSNDDSNETVIPNIKTTSSPIQSIDLAMNAACKVLDDAMLSWNLKITETLKSSVKEQMDRDLAAAREQLVNMEQSLDDANKKNIEGEQSIIELMKDLDEVKAKLAKIEKTNANLNDVLDQSKRENNQLKQENGQLKQQRGKLICRCCGKLQDGIYYCNAECLQTYTDELVMNIAKGSDDATDHMQTD